MKIRLIKQSQNPISVVEGLKTDLYFFKRSSLTYLHFINPNPFFKMFIPVIK